MTDPPSAGGSSGDELEDLLLAELEEQAELDAATAPIENEQKDAPSQKRQKTVGGKFIYFNRYPPKLYSNQCLPLPFHLSCQNSVLS